MSLGMANEDESIQDVVRRKTKKVDADKDNNDNTQQDIESDKTTESVASKVRKRIVFGALANVELEEKDNPLRSSFLRKIRTSILFIPRHIIDGLHCGLKSMRCWAQTTGL
jgi:hypothetical protein